MNKYNKNAIVFILVFALIGAGLISDGIPKGIGSTVLEFLHSREEAGVTEAFRAATSGMEKKLSDGVSYHAVAMDLNSLFNRYIGRKIIEKEDSTVIRAANGYLGNPRPEMPDEEVELRADSVEHFMKTVEGCGAQLVYVMAPSKGYSLQYPSNAGDFTASNCDRFAAGIRERGVPFLSLIEQAEKEGISDEEMFFVTDHHWRTEMGLWAADRVSAFLGEISGFEYDHTVLDKDNYDVTVYKDWFLGSQGKKVGRYFSPHGVDDINLIVPEFETSLVEEQPAKGLIREGSFRDLLYMDNLRVKDHYGLNPYATYGGGDFREQIITNRLNRDGKTAVVIRDSFGCAFTPFFSLVMGRTHIVDIRDGGYVGEKLNLPEYIEKVNPDYVIIIYTGLTGGDSLYAFE